MAPLEERTNGAVTSMPSGTAGTRAGADQQGQGRRRRRRKEKKKAGRDRITGQGWWAGARGYVLYHGATTEMGAAQAGRLAVTDKEDVFVDDCRQAAAVVRRRAGMGDGACDSAGRWASAGNCRVVCMGRASRRSSARPAVGACWTEGRAGRCMAVRCQDTQVNTVMAQGARPSLAADVGRSR